MELNLARKDLLKTAWRFLLAILLLVDKITATPIKLMRAVGEDSLRDLNMARSLARRQVDYLRQEESLSRSENLEELDDRLESLLTSAILEDLVEFQKRSRTALKKRSEFDDLPASISRGPFRLTEADEEFLSEEAYRRGPAEESWLVPVSRKKNPPFIGRRRRKRNVQLTEEEADSSLLPNVQRLNVQSSLNGGVGGSHGNLRAFAPNVQLSGRRRVRNFAPNVQSPRNSRMLRPNVQLRGASRNTRKFAPQPWAETRALAQLESGGTVQSQSLSRNQQKAPSRLRNIRQFVQRTHRRYTHRLHQLKRNLWHRIDETLKERNLYL